MTTIKNKKTRFDTRLSEEQKSFFERAAILGGYRSLTDFMILSAQKHANEIIKETEQVITSEKDKEIFFNAIINPSKPNENLISAAKEYKSLSSK